MHAVNERKMDAFIHWVRYATTGSENECPKGRGSLMSNEARFSRNKPSARGDGSVGLSSKIVSYLHFDAEL